MADIVASDLKWFRPERLTDFSDGGGRVTATEIPAGEVGNVFASKSSIDIAIGDVSVRKVYGLVTSQNTAPLVDAHAVLTSRPTDPLVDVTLFQTGSWIDERAQAAVYVESFLGESVYSRYRLYGELHRAGQQTIQVYVLDATVGPPGIGEVFQLDTNKSGYTPATKFVRVLEILTDEIIEVVDYLADKEITIRVYTWRLASTLGADFYGGEPTAKPDPAPTKVRTSVPVDAARYYGVQPLAVTAEEGDIYVQVASLYQSVVPAAQNEDVLIDQSGNPSATAVIAVGTATVSLSVALSMQPGQSYYVYFPRAVAPGTLALSFSGVNYVDRSDGSLALAGGELGNLRGAVNYAGGNIALSVVQAASGTVAATARMAVPVGVRSYSCRQDITAANLAYNYTAILWPPPSAGTARAEYRAENHWYTISDAGAQGQLSGDGTGSVNFATGSALASLLRQPDPGTSVIWTWGTKVTYVDVTSSTEAAYEVEYASDPLVPFLRGSCVWTWTSGAVQRTATDSNGAITGDATGTVLYGAGKWSLRTAYLPDPGAELEFEFDARLAGVEEYTYAVPGGASSHQIAFTLPGAPIEPGSVSFEWEIQSPALYSLGVLTESFTAADDGQGVSGAILRDGETEGSITYATGAGLLTVEPAEYRSGDITIVYPPNYQP